ncbi:type II toxin-antitoxin system HicB family antitoxin [Candidatus Methanocrinis natronophilus]|uniref:Type II toxin-antitoxin system HicB family antitoxin n=1 Tax=Candidatus Methanocrinis natronophilus TaxID=3033396 RepID=A0ABT5X796_9EURY|nr:type II toxin-antitoxin system HicB family antitoxin [Candidatus Methanocrinis natronophilus]MDF0590556.1 type II toxin-antitoxin system HicB family antitoxin [Candidatus Methanocrinis natronophilus]
MTEYTIIIEKSGDNFSAYCPDLPGVIATGKTTEETTGRMKEAIEFHIEGQISEKMPVPEPTTTARSIKVAV